MLDKGMVQFHKKATMGIVPKEMDCLRLLLYIGRGETRSPSAMSSQRNVELDKLFYQWLAKICMGTLQLAAADAWEALGELRGADVRSSRLAEALDEEVEALQRCSEAAVAASLA